MATYPQVHQPRHPLAPATGFLSTHRIVLYDKIGPGEHPCHWCGKLVHWEKGHQRKGTALLTDHIDGNPKNCSLENLVPACNRCNTRRSHPKNIQEGEEWTLNRSGLRTRAIKKTCLTCGGSFLIQKSEEAKRPFLYCSSSCMHQGRRAGRDQEIQQGIPRLIVTNKDGSLKYLHGEECTCQTCGKTFIVSLHRLKQGGAGRYCGRTCLNNRPRNRHISQSDQAFTSESSPQSIWVTSPKI